MPKKTAMPHLSSAVAFESNGLGACFYRAAAFVLDAPGADLCLGTFAGGTEEELRANPSGSRHDFIHAWVEARGDVYAPSMLSKSNDFMGPIPRDRYYEANGARDIKRLTRSEVLRLSGEIGLSAHLRRHKPLKGGKRVAEVLLEAAGVNYMVKDGGVLPAPRSLDVDGTQPTG